MNRLGHWLLKRRAVVHAISALTLNSYVTQNVTKGIPCAALNCHACPAASFACPIGVLQHFIARGQIPFYTLGFIGLVGALVGRLGCGWACPFGWFQDILHKIPVRKWRLPNRFNWTRYIVLGLLVLALPLATHELWFCKLCPAGALEASIPTPLIFAEVRDLIGGFYWLKMAILAAFIAWMIVTSRPFCRWVCPLGTLWSFLNRNSAIQIAVDQGKCTRCDRCKTVCPVDIRIYENPASAMCIRCMECVSACPAECISVASRGWTVETDQLAQREQTSTSANT